MFREDYTFLIPLIYLRLELSSLVDDEPSAGSVVLHLLKFMVSEVSMARNLNICFSPLVLPLSMARIEERVILEKEFMRERERERASLQRMKE